MKKNRPRLSKKSGLPPGTPVYTGERDFANVHTTVAWYNADEFREDEVADFDFVPSFGHDHTVWINMNGVHRPEKIEPLGRLYGIHHLALEDIVNTTQRPKIVDYDDHSYIVVTDFRYTEHELTSEQISIIVKENAVLVFQEDEFDQFAPLRERLRNKKGQGRLHDADYLVYLILDAIVDNYFVIMERITANIEDLESEIVDNPTHETMHGIYRCKKELAMLTRAAWPLRRLLAEINKDAPFVVEETIKPYYRDLHDHVIRIIEMTEGVGEIIMGMFEMYGSAMSIRLGNIMKVLTVITTIFIPLSFIAGIYGMNFRHMPGLEWEWGFVVVMTIMGAMALIMLLLFKRNKWM